MNMVYLSGNQLIFRKDNEKEYQPYFGSTAKSNLRGSILPEMSEEAFDALCSRLNVPRLNEKIAALTDLTVRTLPFPSGPQNRQKEGPSHSPSKLDPTRAGARGFPDKRSHLFNMCLSLTALSIAHNHSLKLLDIGFPYDEPHTHLTTPC
jgi:hypothetical protein